MSKNLMNLEMYTSSLFVKDGIFFTGKEGKVSYPESGNDASLQLEENSFWFNHRNNCILAAVQKYCPDKIFFDIGGGNGYTSKLLESNGILTVLVEPGLNGCINAKKRGLKNIVCSTLENAALNKGSVPAIGLFDVVEHIEKDVEFLKMVNGYLEDYGYTFITVPAYKFLWSNEDVFGGHFRRYTLKVMNEKLRDAGFKIVYSTYIFSILPLPIYLMRTIPSKLGFFEEGIEIDVHKKNHNKNKGLFDKVFDKIWKYELNRVIKSEKIPFGGSCFVVARKSN